MTPVAMTVVAEFEKAVARMELRGIPFDVDTYAEIQQHRSRITGRMVEAVNEQCPVFTGVQLNRDAFLAWARREGIRWPAKTSERTGHAYYPIDQDTLKSMETHHPFIAEVRQVQKTVKALGKRAIVVDPTTQRHYFDTFMYRSITGRNQPHGFVFAGPKWMRYLIVADDEYVLVYVDYVAQEVGLAAALSGDPTMRAVYEASDCHMAFAIRAGAAPADATKATHPDVRKRYKTVNLGVMYGQSAYGIAQRLGITFQEAAAILDEHRSMFTTFWTWTERMIQGSYDRGYIVTPCGWRSIVLPGSNERTWQNWSMQSAGGDIMRLTMVYLDRQNVQLLAPVHDGFLLTCRRSQLDDLRAAVNYACRMAVEHVIPGFPLRWDFTIYEDRFEDEDGWPMWDRLQNVLKEIET